MSTLLTNEESKALLALCGTGKFYDVERWTASGKSICTPASIQKTPLQVAVDTGFHSLVELFDRNEARREQEDRALQEAVDSRRLDMVEALVKNGARIQAVPLVDVAAHLGPRTDAVLL